MSEVWRKLERFTVGDADASFSYMDRLARENGWTREFTKKVYREYLKFLYLAVVSDQQVTPSEEVDQAWHLHLCYTDSYWNDLCRDTLGVQIHHGPTKGGAFERSRFDIQYADTLHLYAAHFDQKPPKDVWPPSRIRFDRRNEFVRVNKKKDYVFKKEAVGLFAVILCAGFGAMCYRSFIDANFPLWVPVSLLALAVVVLLARLNAEASRTKRQGRSKGVLSTGCGGCGGFFGGDAGGGDSGCGGGCGGAVVAAVELLCRRRLSRFALRSSIEQRRCD